MDLTYYKEAVVKTPEMANLTKTVAIGDGNYAVVTVPVEEKLEMAEKAINAAWNMVVTKHDFPFLRRESTFATEADVADYTLKGASSDCRDVVNILQGTTVLQKMRLVDYQRKYSGQVAASTVAIWVDFGRSGKYPVVRLVGTPSEVKTYTYFYRRDGVNVEDMPDVWSHVLVRLAMGGLFPATHYRLGMKALKNMVDDYTRSGGEMNPIPMDANWRTRNIQRNKKYGY